MDTWKLSDSGTWKIIGIGIIVIVLLAVLLLFFVNPAPKTSCRARTAHHCKRFT